MSVSKVLEGYGCTESCGLITMAVAGDLKGGIIGVPMPSCEVKVIDVPEMNLVAARDNKGEVGPFYAHDALLLNLIGYLT